MEVEITRESAWLSCFGALPDPRIERKKLHKLMDILVLTLCAVMSGATSWETIEDYAKGKKEWLKTFLELRRNHNRIVLLLEMLSHGNEHLPFFGGNPKRVVVELRRRFRLDLHDRDAAEFVHTLIETSAGNWTTTCYDRYQRCCVGIF